MSYAYLFVCIGLCAMALCTLNKMGRGASYYRRATMLMVAVGAFGGIVRPWWPDEVSTLCDLALLGGFGADWLIREHWPALYQDRA